METGSWKEEKPGRRESRQENNEGKIILFVKISFSDCFIFLYRFIYISIQLKINLRDFFYRFLCAGLQEFLTLHR